MTSMYQCSDVLLFHTSALQSWHDGRAVEPAAVRPLRNRQGALSSRAMVPQGQGQQRVFGCQFLSSSWGFIADSLGPSPSPLPFYVRPLSPQDLPEVGYDFGEVDNALEHVGRHVGQVGQKGDDLFPVALGRGLVVPDAAVFPSQLQRDLHWNPVFHDLIPCGRVFQQ